MSSGENGEGERGEEGRRTSDVFNGIFFKGGFKLKVISMFMLERRKSKNCVRLHERACLRLYVRAGSNYAVLQAFRPTTI